MRRSLAISARFEELALKLCVRAASDALANVQRRSTLSRKSLMALPAGLPRLQLWQLTQGISMASCPRQ